MTKTYNVTITATRAPQAYQLRDAIARSLEATGECKVVGAGLNCIDPSIADLDVRFKSIQSARLSIAAIRAAYSHEASIDIS